jgi:hypothetical protein
MFYLEMAVADEQAFGQMERRLAYLEKVLSMVEGLLDVLFHEGWFHTNRNLPFRDVGR